MRHPGSAARAFSHWREVGASAVSRAANISSLAAYDTIIASQRNRRATVLAHASTRRDLKVGKPMVLTLLTIALLLGVAIDLALHIRLLALGRW